MIPEVMCGTYGISSRPSRSRLRINARKMSDKVWKQAERRIARLFNTTRTPLSGGSSRHTRSDILHDNLYVEVKYRRNFSPVRWWKEAEERSKKENKFPVLALVQKNSKVVYAFVPLDKSYLKKLAGHL